MIGVQICTNLEWNCIKDIFRVEKQAVYIYPYGEYFCEHINDQECILFRGGPGKTKSSGACQYAIDHWNLSKVIVIGTCGGVDEKLNVLDIIVGDKTVHYDFLNYNNNESIFYEQLAVAIDLSDIDTNKFDTKVKVGLIATADFPLDNTEKVQLLRNNNVLCADCESAAIALICKINNINILVIRGVTDVPDDNVSSLDKQVDDCTNNTPIIIKKIVEKILFKIVK